MNAATARCTVPPSKATATNGYSNPKARWPDGTTSEALTPTGKGRGATLCRPFGCRWVGSAGSGYVGELRSRSQSSPQAWDRVGPFSHFQGLLSHSLRSSESSETLLLRTLTLTRASASENSRKAPQYAPCSPQFKHTHKRNSPQSAPCPGVLSETKQARSSPLERVIIL